MPPGPPPVAHSTSYDRAPLLNGDDEDDDDDYLYTLSFKDRVKIRIERVLKQYLDYAAPVEDNTTTTHHKETHNIWNRANDFLKTAPERADRARLWAIPFVIATFALFIYLFVTFALYYKTTADASNVHSDVAILMHNDLYGENSLRTAAAIVVSKPMKQADSARECAYLGEALLQPNLVEDFEETLRYLSFVEKTPKTTKFWVTGKTDDKCHAIEQTGKAHAINCNDRLPALCSQRAPLASTYDGEVEDRFHLRVPLGKNHSIIGYRDKRTFRFLGVRYAQEPRRFEHSTLYEGEEDELALQTRSECAQGARTGEEDCLFINVWTPFLPLDAKSKKRLKPVIVWIHGGAFVSGSGSRPLYDGGNLASRGDVVVVSFNYRLGTLGFLSFQGVGNFGIGDQLTALQWVHKHIRRLGGDPKNVVIMGQSAGASSVHALLGSPKARGLFSAAIMHSNAGGFGYAKPYTQRYSLDDAYEEHTKPILQEKECLDVEDPLACMRKIGVHELAAMPHQHRFVVQDNNIVTAPDLKFEGSGKMASVPIIMGVTNDDAVQFTGVSSANLTSALTQFGLNATAIEGSGLFPKPDGDIRASTFGVLVRVFTDNMFRCMAQATATAAVKHNAVPKLWFYNFDRTLHPDTGFPQCRAPADAAHPHGNPALPYYRCHSGDLLYAFGNMAWMHIEDRDGEDFKFSQYVVDSWSQFAWNHDPNPNLEYLDARGYTNTTLALKILGAWPAVGKGADGLKLRSLKAQSENIPFKEQEQCKLLGFGVDYYG